MVIKPPNDNINKLLDVLGIDYHNAISVDIRIAVEETVTATIVRYVELDNEKIKELKKYKLVEIE